MFVIIVTIPQRFQVVLAGGNSAATAAAVEEVENVAAPGDVASLTAAAELVLSDDKKWPTVQVTRTLEHGKESYF